MSVSGAGMIGCENCSLGLKEIKDTMGKTVRLNIRCSCTQGLRKLKPFCKDFLGKIFLLTFYPWFNGHLKNAFTMTYRG